MATKLRAWDALLDLQRSIEASRGSGWFGATTTGYGTFPPVNVFREGDDFVLVAELPGVEKEGLDVQIKGRQVRIRGNKTVEFADGVSVHRRERRSGSFDRALVIPAEIDGDKVRAEYRDGVLALHLPRSDADRPRSVQIS
jgi:HSP20 family protein